MPPKRRVGRPRGRKGQGIKSTARTIARKAKPIAKTLAPILVNKVIIPMIKKKLEGGSLRLAGQRGRAGGRKRRS